jgi:quinol monooxygenase YgiN
MIAVVACIEVVPGRRDDFLREFRKLVPQVRAEAGCLEYVPMLDLPTSIGGQAPVGENLVTVLEKWATVEALEAHLMAPHMVAYRKVAKDLVQGMTLRILTPA